MKAARVFMLALLPALAWAQDPAEMQRWFEAGRYQEVVKAVAPDAAPEVIYLAAQSYQKLGSNEQALMTYDRLVQRPETDVWHFIGVAGRQLAEGQPEASAASAREAVGVLDAEAAAHFQLGLALAKLLQWADAAAAFDAASERQPAFAYAYYYGGLMQYRAGRTDRMAIRFEQFLKLAPEAPERPEVLSIMRTIRRR